MKQDQSKKKLGRAREVSFRKGEGEGKRKGQSAREREGKKSNYIGKAEQKKQRGEKLGVVPKILQARGLHQSRQNNAGTASSKSKK